MSFNTEQSLNQIISLASKKLDQAELFFGHGTDNAWDEACWLVETLAQRHGYNQLDPGMYLDQALLAEIRELLRLRVELKKPLAYLLNEAWFAGLPFYVNEKVIIPRSPIAELIKNHFTPVLKEDPLSILDLCCGSGCIGIACGLEYPDAELVLADLSSEALTVAEINLGRYEMRKSAQVVESNLFDNISDRFDIIISNPPYVSKEEYESLPAEYGHEPALALVSELDGLAIPLDILKKADEHLNPGGVLVLEVGFSWQSLLDLYPDAPFLWFEFEHGGEGVLALSKEQLSEYTF